MLARRKSDFAGVCAVCNKSVRFSIDRLSGEALDVNCRETFACPRCGLNNRSRLSTHFLLSSAVERDSKIYVTEQATALYRQFKRLFPSVVGSEYVAGGRPERAVQTVGDTKTSRGSRLTTRCSTASAPSTCSSTCRSRRAERVPSAAWDQVGGC
jgi:hypothetical protein